MLERIHYSALGGTVQAFTAYNITGDCSSGTAVVCDPLDFSNIRLRVTYRDSSSMLQSVERGILDVISSGVLATPIEWYFDQSVTIQTARLIADLTPQSFLTDTGPFVSNGQAFTQVIDFTGNTPGSPVYGLITTAAEATGVVPEPAQLVPLSLLLGGLIYFVQKRR